MQEISHSQGTFIYTKVFQFITRPQPCTGVNPSEQKSIKKAYSYNEHAWTPVKSGLNSAQNKYSISSTYILNSLNFFDKRPEIKSMKFPAVPNSFLLSNFCLFRGLVP